MPGRSDYGGIHEDTLRDSTLARRGSLVLSVALFALAGVFGPPAAAHAQFPAFIPMANTPSGVAVDKTGNVYVSVRDGARGVI